MAECASQRSPDNLGAPLRAPEVLPGVGADGVGVKFPIFAVNCCCSPLSFRRRGEKRRKTKKSEKKTTKKCVKIAKKCVKKGENHSDPIHTNPIKNLPTEHHFSSQSCRSCYPYLETPKNQCHQMLAASGEIRYFQAAVCGVSP